MNFWLKLSDGVFLFGQGGITSVKSIDLRDKPDSYIYRTELYSGATKVATVTEPVDKINIWIEKEGQKCL